MQRFDVRHETRKVEPRPVENTTGLYDAAVAIIAAQQRVQNTLRGTLIHIRLEERQLRVFYCVLHFSSASCAVHCGNGFQATTTPVVMRKGNLCSCVFVSTIARWKIFSHRLCVHLIVDSLSTNGFHVSTKCAQGLHFQWIRSLALRSNPGPALTSSSRCIFLAWLKKAPRQAAMV